MLHEGWVFELVESRDKSVNNVKKIGQEDARAREPRHNIRTLQNVKNYVSELRQLEGLALTPVGQEVLSPAVCPSF